MKDCKVLINQSVREIEASRKTSATEVGHNKPKSNSVELQDVINQVFALFRINYHNQYHAAFGDTQLLNQAKKLWLESLGHFSREQILRGAKDVIESSDYLPTLHRMIDCCEKVSGTDGLPPVREAYLEACLAPSPKAAYDWSHPAVYFAGLETGWHLLASAAEAVSFPKFSDHYRHIARQVAHGKAFPAPNKILAEKASPALPRKENIKKLQQLRENLKL